MKAWVSIRDVIIVSHRIILKVMTCILLSLDNSYFWKFKQDLGAVHVIDFTEGRYSVCALNEKTHLKSMALKDSNDF